jgi:hypothetical protein
MGSAKHSLKTLLQLPCGWRCSRQIISSDGIPSISAENAKQHNALNVLNAATLFIVVVGAGYSISPAQGRHYGLYFPFATGTAVTLLVHEKFLPSRLPPSPVHTGSLHRRYKIYNVNWE